MRELQLNLTNGQNMGAMCVDVDGSPVKLKRGANGSLTGKFETSADRVNIRIYRLMDVGGFLWFITQLIFFLISILGIFDARRGERCVVIDYEAEVELGEVNVITFSFYSVKDNFKAVEAVTLLKLNELSNVYFVDKKAKRILKGLKIAKILLFFAVIAAAILALIALI